jgi:cyclic dehypoxanthinyl futalosine synthase
LFDEIGETIEMGGTGVRLVCGVDLAIIARIECFEGLLRGIKQRFPNIWIEGLSAAEIRSIGAGLGLGLRETIERLMDAGLDSIAGDGAGLVGGSVEEWLEVHRVAHGLGMRTVAGITFGSGETLEQRVEFLEAVRRLQEETGGFAVFAPVAAEAPGGRELDGVTAVERLKTLAIARMFLDNIENVQACGSVQGLKVLQMGLRFGANDVGLVGLEGGSEEDVRRIIRDAGFMPAQRDMAYRAMMLA